MADQKADKPKETKSDDRTAEPATEKTGIEIDIVGPLTFWIVMLVIGVLLSLFIAPLSGNVGNTALQTFAKNVGSWILYLPGSLILPLVIALWVGERVGAKRNKVSSAVTIGLINAAYAALVYAVSIFIIYLLLYYISPSLLPSQLATFLIYVVAIPILLVVVLIPIVGALSAARHSSM